MSAPSNLTLLLIAAITGLTTIEVALILADHTDTAMDLLLAVAVIGWLAWVLSD